MAFTMEISKAQTHINRTGMPTSYGVFTKSVILYSSAISPKGTYWRVPRSQIPSLHLTLKLPSSPSTSDHRHQPHCSPCHHQQPIQTHQHPHTTLPTAEASNHISARDREAAGGSTNVYASNHHPMLNYAAHIVGKIQNSTKISKPQKIPYSTHMATQTSPSSYGLWGQQYQGHLQLLGARATSVDATPYGEDAAMKPAN